MHLQSTAVLMHVVSLDLLHPLSYVFFLFLSCPFFLTFTTLELHYDLQFFIVHQSNWLIPRVQFMQMWTIPLAGNISRLKHKNLPFFENLESRFNQKLTPKIAIFMHKQTIRLLITKIHHFYEDFPAFFIKCIYWSVLIYQKVFTQASLSLLFFLWKTLLF